MKTNNYLKIRSYKIILILIGCLGIFSCSGVGAQGIILYISEKDGNPEIYSTDTRGQSHSRLTSTSKREDIPKLSPDGSHIAFISDRKGSFQLWVMSIEGDEEKLISKKGEIVATVVESFFWSPDSQKIVYKWNNSGQHDISLYDMQSGIITSVTNDQAVEVLGDWSPSGEWIVYSVIANPDVNRVGIFKKNPQGVDEVQLTTEFEDYNARWSPDGRKIAFLSKRSQENTDIYVIDADAKSESENEEKNITISGGGNNWDFSWSPDGKRVVFVSDSEQNPEIFVVDINDSSQIIRLTNNNSQESAPIWRENKIIFLSDSDGDSDLYSMKPSDGSNQKRLTETVQAEYSPSLN